MTESALSSEANATTVLPAPSGVSATTNANNNVDITWTNNDDSTDGGIDVERSTDGFATVTTVATNLSPSTTTYTDTSTAEGTTYEYRIERNTDHASATSGTDSVTTNVTAAPTGPVSVSVTTPDAGASTTPPPDVTAAPTGPISVSVTTPDAGASTTAAPDVTAAPTGPISVSVTTADAGAVIPVVAPSNLSTAYETPTEWDITWTDESSGEDEYEVERRRKYDGGYGAWSSLATLAADSTSYTDSGVVPDTTYEYRVTARENGNAQSTTAEFTTPGLGYGKRRVTSSGWTVEVVPTDGGNPRRPSIVGDPNYDPSIKSLPRVELPVRKDEAWSRDKWEDATVRVWEDGVRLPIEQLRSVEHQPGQTTLTAIGGTELLEPQGHEFETDIHAAAGTVIDKTSYGKVVDAPSVTDSQLLQEVTTPDEIAALYRDPGVQFPVVIDDTGTVPTETGITLAQTCFFEEAEANATNSTHVNDYPGSTPFWSDDEAVALRSDDDEVRFDIDLDYEIPAGQVGFAAHITAYQFRGIVEAKINGQTTEELDLTAQDSTFSDTYWEDKNTGANGVEWTSTLSPGTHSIEISARNNTSGDYYVDAVAVFDKRYHDLNNFDELTSGSYMNTPALYPTGGTELLFRYSSFRSLIGATFDDSTFSDTSGDQSIEVSNDGGDNWATCTNCTSLDTDFTDPSGDILIRVTLDAWGDRTGDPDIASPTQNYKTQVLREWDISGDIRDSAPLRNDVFEGDARNTLTKLADRGNALWAVTWDDGIQVEFTNAGQRTNDRNLDLVDYTWDKETLDRQVVWADIKGGAQQVSGEAITADIGNAVRLVHDNLITGSEQVTNQDGSTTYERGVDYEMEYAVGNVRPTTVGEISDGETVVVDYEWKPRGEYAEDTVEKKKLVRTFVGATDDATCRAIAYYLTEELADPVRSGDAVIDDLPPGVSVLDALAFDPLPETDTYHVEQINRRPGEISLTLADRIRVQDAVSNISSTLGGHGDRI